jgi:hypothetical protein
VKEIRVQTASHRIILKPCVLSPFKVVFTEINVTLDISVAVQHYQL